ncbi:NAD-dependent protein deacetylase sirtuin-7 [Lamellibrachia satsuma]|nr:NAD-dependent protein deacetylase sirtuin-7 [Lamellibrachia satsuma]
MEKDVFSTRTARKCAEISRILEKEESRSHVRRVTHILKKSEHDRSDEEKLLLLNSVDIVLNIEKRANTRMLTKQRLLEIEDSEDVLREKCVKLAEAIRDARHVVIYTGAGISTAASIPDYRGPNGVWTLLQQGKEVMAPQLSDAEPTYTHMCIAYLCRHHLVKHVVSQNCDALHLRSGLPRHALSELHGNMYIEVCNTCEHPREYIRLFDLTERTGVRRHQTGRQCSHCGAQLHDTIVHFGEKGRLTSPYNWKEAAQMADHADLILCLGTSLKVKVMPCHQGHTMSPRS